MLSIDMNSLPELFEQIGEVMAQNAELLCEMDARMGDGDLGLTMKKGFNAMPDILRGIDEPDVGKKLAKAGMKMASVVPSTMGTLMASGIMEGGKALVGRQSIDAEGMVDFLSGFSAGIIKRGKCSEGDRTVLDVIAPAAHNAREAFEATTGKSLLLVAQAALKGAQNGLEATKDMTPKFGKAAIHAAKAAGTEDQGAFAGMLMIKGILAYIMQNTN